jgi:proteasome activator subunit 4
MLASQYYLLTFLPQSHPQTYFPALFRVWNSINSYAYDERMLSFLSKLVELHVDPTVSDPKKLAAIPDDARSEDEGRPNWKREDLDENGNWSGVYKDVGIFTHDEWSHLMVKCLVSMGTLRG